MMALLSIALGCWAVYEACEERIATASVLILLAVIAMAVGA